MPTLFANLDGLHCGLGLVFRRELSVLYDRYRGRRGFGVNDGAFFGGTVPNDIEICWNGGLSSGR